MEILLTVSTPVFGIALLGFVAAKAGWFDERGQEALALFVFNFAAPALLFRALATRGLPADLPFALLGAYYLGGIAVWLAAMAVIGVVFRRRLDELAVAGMSAAFPNTVLLGIPLILTAFGPDAEVPLFLVLAFHSLLYFPSVTVLIEAGRGEGAGILRILANTLRGLVRNPIVMGILCGILWGLLALPLPRAIDGLLELLAEAVAPCALFTVGASIAGFRIAGSLSEAAVAVVCKLFLHPLLVWLLASQVFALPDLWIKVVVLLAALPTGVNAFIFAQRYGVWQRRAGTAVAVSTGLSMITLTLLLQGLAGP